MLKSNEEEPNTKRIQSSIRHQVRKLRAKVKALIPGEVCAHFEERNEKVSKINMLRSQYYARNQTKTRMHRTWKSSTHHINADTMPQRQKNDNNEGCQKYFQFEKLNQFEIQQINEDKNYYLGEKNVQAFNIFLKQIKGKMETVEGKQMIKSVKNDSIGRRSLQRNASIVFQSQENQKIMDRLLKTSQGKTQHHLQNKHAFSTKLLQKSHTATKIRITVHGNEKWNQLNLNFKSDKGKSQSEFPLSKHSKMYLKDDKPYQHKQKKDLEEEQQQKRMNKKLKLQMQMAKAENNQREQKYKKFFSLKQRAINQQQKLKKVKSKQTLMNCKGEIRMYTQELRNIVVHRKTMKQPQE